MATPAVSARVFLLGRFAVEVTGRLVPAASWTKRRPIEVLVALALAPGRVLHREELIDRLWPDKDLEAGANNLHRALHDLRRVTEMDIATLDRGVARLADTAWVDVGSVRAGGGEHHDRRLIAGARALCGRALARRSLLRCARGPARRVCASGSSIPACDWRSCTTRRASSSELSPCCGACSPRILRSSPRISSSCRCSPSRAVQATRSVNSPNAPPRSASGSRPRHPAPRSS